MNPDQKRTAEDRVVERALRALLPLAFQRHQALVKAGYKPRYEIAAYNDEASLRAMKPDEPQLTLSIQRRINQALVDQLRSMGIQVALIPVEADEYFKWLDSYGLENTAGNRAQFVAWTTCPDRNSFQPDASVGLQGTRLYTGASRSKNSIRVNPSQEPNLPSPPPLSPIVRQKN